MRLGAASLLAVTWLSLVPAIAAAQSPSPLGETPKPPLKADSTPAPVPMAAQPAPPPGLVPAFPPGTRPPGGASVTPAPGMPAPGMPPTAAPQVTPSPYPPGYYYPPPGYGVAPGYYAPPGYNSYMYPPGTSLLPPAILAYDEGETVPAGYKLKASPVRTLVVTGSVLFGTTYLASLIGGATVVAGSSSDAKSFAPMFAPLVGPFITIGTVSASGAGALWLVLDGLAQTAGVAMLVSGMVLEEKYLERVATGQATALERLAHPQVFVGARSGVVRWSL